MTAKSINTQEKIFEIMTSTRVEYPIQNVIDLAVAYISTGNLKASARGADINMNTARDWTKQQWFADVLDLVRYEHQSKLDAKMTALLDRDLKEIEDRLVNGDINANGKKVPVSASQLASIFGTLYDKRALIRGEPTSRVERVSVDQQLNKLHKRFEEIGKTALTSESVDEEPHVEH